MHYTRRRQMASPLLAARAKAKQSAVIWRTDHRYRCGAWLKAVPFFSSMPLDVAAAMKRFARLRVFLFLALRVGVRRQRLPEPSHRLFRAAKTPYVQRMLARDQLEVFVRNALIHGVGQQGDPVRRRTGDFAEALDESRLFEPEHRFRSGNPDEERQMRRAEARHGMEELFRFFYRFAAYQLRSDEILFNGDRVRHRALAGGEQQSVFLPRRVSARPFALTEQLELVCMVAVFVHHPMQRFCAAQ